MAKKLAKKDVPHLKTEDAVDRWLQKADLTQYFSGDEFEKVRFQKLERNLIEKSYESSQKSQPVTLRLPLGLIQRLKLLAMKKGMAYQTMARLLLHERVNRLLSH